MPKQDKLIVQLFKDTPIIFLLSMFTAAVGGIIDGIITGKFLGTESMAAFGFTVPYQNFTSIFPFVVALGMQVLCSKNLGAGNIQESNKVFSLAITAAVCMAIFLTSMTIIFTGQTADLLGSEKELGMIRTLTEDYLQAYSLGLPAIAAVAIFTPIMQLDCDRRRAVISVAVLSVCNVTGNLLNVFVLDGGLWGMGIVTAISYWVASGILLLHFLKADANFIYTPKGMNLKLLPEMFLFGCPVILGRGSTVLRGGFFNRIAVALAGGSGIAAYAILENFSRLIEIIPKALGASTQMIGGILIGEKDHNSIRRLIIVSLKFSLIIAMTMAAVLIFIAPLIARIYTRNDAQAYQMTLEGIRWIALGLPFCAMFVVLQYFYQAYGRFKLVSTLAVGCNIGFTVLTALI